MSPSDSGSALRVAVLVLPTTPLSLRVYVDEISRRLPAYGVQPLVFSQPTQIPPCDLLWDPRTGGGRAPTPELVADQRPLVATLLDVAHLSLPWHEFHPSWREAWRGWFDARKLRAQWQAAYPRVHTIIAPSVVTQREAGQCLALPASRFVVVPLGVDHAQFSAEQPDDLVPAVAALAQPYFLHVSHYQPRKNIARIVDAYAALPEAGRPPLVMKVFGHPQGVHAPGVCFIGGELTRPQIAALYRHALGFVFPSLNEGFGLPILEAMASGCAVITSRGTACSEVAGDAALLVDPRSVPSISGAMHQLWQDAELRARLALQGQQHGSAFTWEASAARHAEVFLAAARRDIAG